MPVYNVTQIQTVTITWAIEAESKELAIARMQGNINAGTQLDVIEYDCDTKYEIEAAENHNDEQGKLR